MNLQAILESLPDATPDTLRAIQGALLRIEEELTWRIFQLEQELLEEVEP